MNKPKSGCKNLYLHILFVILIGGIGVQTFTSCSADVDETPIPPTIEPLSIAPLGVTAVVDSENNIIVGWGFVTGATGYYIYRSTNAAGVYTLIGSSMETSYTDSDFFLSPGTTYYYRVAAYNNEGIIGSQSAFTYATTLNAPNDAPADVTAYPNSTSSITVSWGSVTGATGYYIYRSPLDDISTSTQIGTSTTNTYTDTGLSFGTAYFYTVVAYNSGGTSYSSASIGVTLLSDVSCVAGSAVTIGTQTWMKTNLNCDVSGSRCYDDNPANCETYGRLYDWATAMNLPSFCNSNSIYCQVFPKKGICPSGWHLPSDEEWSVLIDYVSGGNTAPAGTKLKSTTGWYDCGPSSSDNSYLCEDEFGFLALPSGSYSYGDFGGAGTCSGGWWCTREDLSDRTCVRDMRCDWDGVGWDGYQKHDLFSVRCVQD